LIRKIDLWLLAAAPVVFLLCWCRHQSYYSLNLLATVASAFLLLLSSCTAFIGLFLQQGDVCFFRQPIFWLSSGIWYYSIGDILFFSTWEYNKKMIYRGLFDTIFLSAEYLFSLTMIACFICLFNQDPRLTGSKDRRTTGGRR